MIPLGEPFDPAADHGRDAGLQGGRSGPGAHVPARSACRPPLSRRAADRK